MRTIIDGTKNRKLLKFFKRKQTFLDLELLDARLKMGYQLDFFLEDDKLVGFVFYVKANKINISNVFDDVEYPDNVSDYVNQINQIPEFIYIDTLEIFNEFKGNGVGTYFYNQLFSGKSVLLYSLYDSMRFWESVGLNLFENGGYFYSNSLVRNSD